MEEASNHDKVIVVEIGGDARGLNINSKILTPRKGLEFDSLVAIKSFYRTYASRKGFG